MTELDQWKEIAIEAIQDAAYWKKECRNLQKQNAQVLYILPHKYTIERVNTGYKLLCNGNFVYFNEELDTVFNRFGNLMGRQNNV